MKAYGQKAAEGVRAYSIYATRNRLPAMQAILSIGRA